MKLTRRSFIKASVASIYIPRNDRTSPYKSLPPPDYDNTFYMLPIFESWHVRKSSDISLRTQEAQEMISRLGPQRPYMKLGFAIISKGDEMDTFALAEKLGICLVLQGGATDHHTTEWGGEGLITGDKGDRRNSQWLNDGAYIASSADPGFQLRACMSIYCKAMYELRCNNDISRAKHVSEAMKRYPDTVIATSGPIEVETQMEGGRFGDYSPYSITEFRDWLTHRNIYDDRNGERRGEGFPGGGRWMSDPSPKDHNGPGPSFNDYFGTAFQTWSLAYWDLDVYPNALPLEAKGMPSNGEQGYVEGGFDAPRTEDKTNVYWLAWSDDDLRHPGFRQRLVRQWVADSTRWLHEAGIPKQRIFSHQVPGQSYGDVRLMLGASPAWTADTPDGSIGITTYFGAASDTSSFSQITGLDSNWGIFEYHPYPINSMAAPPNAYSHSLNVCMRFRSHILTPISWQDLNQKQSKDFIVNRGPFPDAIHAIFTVLPDRPYNDRSSRQYIPPPVRELRLSHSNSKYILSWSPYVWRGSGWRWVNLRQFKGFEVWHGRRKLTVTQNSEIMVPGIGEYKVKVKWSHTDILPPPPDKINSDNGVLRWNEPGGLFLKQFVVEYSTSPVMSRSKRYITAANEFPLPIGEIEYYCRICGMNGDGSLGLFSSIIKVVMPVKSVSNLPIVRNVLAYGKDMSGKMLLTWSDKTPTGVLWQDMPGFECYCIYHGSDRSFTPSKSNLVASTTQNRLMDNHFNAGEPWYRVTVLFKDGSETPPSESVAYVP